jgi:hypothetical protein
MTPISAKIKSKAYWRIRIRPAEYIPTRVADISSLRPLVERLSVRFRGWYFPHVEMDINSIGIYQSYVEQETEWDNHIELWRLYQSGQFAYLGALHTDWPSSFAGSGQVSNVLFIEDLVGRYVEVLEFAARLSASPAGSKRMWLQIGLHGVGSRTLASYSPMSSIFLQARAGRFADANLILDGEFPAEELLAESEQIALRWVQNVFRHFNWSPEYAVLEGVRDQFYRTSRPDG